MIYRHRLSVVLTWWFSAKRNWRCQEWKCQWHKLWRHWLYQVTIAILILLIACCYSLAIVYTFYAVSNVFTPVIVSILGPSISMFAAASIYLFVLPTDALFEIFSFVFQYIRAFVYVTNGLVDLFSLNFTWYCCRCSLDSRRCISSINVRSDNSES